MPRTWSYRKREHIDLHPERRMPLAGVLLIAFGGMILLCVLSLSIWMLAHPASENPVTAPMAAPAVPPKDD